MTQDSRCISEILLKIRYFEWGLSKSLKKLTSLSKAVPFNGQDYQKQKGPGTSDSSFSVYEAISEKSLY